MYKLKKRPLKRDKPPVLYNIVENYTDFDPPGNVMVCAMTEPENIALHAKVLAESYDIPMETMTTLLTEGGIYLYPQTGALVTRGLFMCKVDPSGQSPKLSWVLDLEQYMEAEQVRRDRGITLEEAAERVFYRTLPPELKERLAQKNLGLDYATIDPAIARAGDIKYIDFRKDWSPYFKRKCIMPDGKMVETSGIEEFAEFHGITVDQAKHLLEHGGIVELQHGVLACQIVNGQPSVARFNARQYAKAKALVESKKLHILDALSEVALNDPVLMRALKHAEHQSR